ncbi:hypothetical protein E7811_16310 [Aliigemmobacter aestuarii]|uniref:Uncharacterized protein n=1 Tax=Aliigemmobacter aestuarii TaxID=1445661 RepID=A0A4S3MJ79_9RHOB|nr:hypothetical protein [Gemmobacter aestuarii]THD81479.1 hypothetical protein E7811_16310 [Gemmobacter aestuarii]
MPAQADLSAALARAVGADRVALLAATLADDLAGVALQLRSAHRADQRRGCHTLVALAALAGDAGLAERARSLLADADAAAGRPFPEGEARALADGVEVLARTASALGAGMAP